MTSNTPPRPKPDTVVVNRPVGKPPRGAVTSPKARARPGAMPLPADRPVTALVEPSVLSKWGDEAAGIRALATDDNVITMFDEIGEGFWTEGITAKKVAAQLRAIGDRPVEVQINSPGGDLFEGISIYNVLREHQQPITIKIMGMAASAASVIAMAGDQVEIGAASFLMIHNCWVVAQGNRHDFRDVADWLEPFDKALRDVYVARTGQDDKAVGQWLDAETYMSGSTAIERGFADALLPADKITVDDKARTRERADNDARIAVLALMAQGHTRTDARARIQALKGMPDAALRDDAMPDAGAAEDWSGLAGLIATLQN